MTKKKIFMIGGAKGVGKTSLSSDVVSEIGIERIETGKLVMEYLLKQLPLEEINDYIIDEIVSRDTNLVLDTHYARYSDIEEPNKQFRRGLESEDLDRLLERFVIFPCLIEVSLGELEQRRRKDSKRRVVSPKFILQEVEFNRRGYEMYLRETGQSPFVVINEDYTNARDALIKWIFDHRGLNE